MMMNIAKIQQQLIRHHTVHVSFSEEDHVYHYKGNVVHTSVTKFMTTHLGFRPFARHIISMCIARRERVSQKTILDRWEHERILGTQFHKYAEKILLKDPHRMIPYIDELQPEVRSFHEYMDVTEGRSYAPRWRQAEYKLSYKTYLASQIDDLKINKDGDIVITDWKRTKPFYPNGTERKRSVPWTTGIFKNILRDCKYDKYRLQVNLYAHLLYKIFGVHVKHMLVVNFYKDKRQIYEMKPLSSIVLDRCLQMAKDYATMQDTNKIPSLTVSSRRNKRGQSLHEPVVHTQRTHHKKKKRCSNTNRKKPVRHSSTFRKRKSARNNDKIPQTWKQLRNQSYPISLQYMTNEEYNRVKDITFF